MPNISIKTETNGTFEVIMVYLRISSKKERKDFAIDIMFLEYS